MEKFINNAPFALVIVILVIGFVLLIKGADFFVEGSSSVAKRLHAQITAAAKDRFMDATICCMST